MILCISGHKGRNIDIFKGFTDFLINFKLAVVALSETFMTEEATELPHELLCSWKFYRNEEHLFKSIHSTLCCGAHSTKIKCVNLHSWFLKVFSVF